MKFWKNKLSIVTKIVRVCVFTFGLVSVIDGGLPSVSEEVRVSGHASGSDHVVSFDHAETDSCKLSLAGYEALQDGDTVSLRTSRLLHHCVELRREDDVILKSRWWKLGCLLTGIILMLTAVFWKAGDEDDDGEGFSLEFELD